MLRFSLAALTSTLLLALACAKAGAPPALDDLRPAGASKGELAARVLHVAGSADVDDGRGLVFPAAAGVGLLESDVVRVGRGSFALLALRNDHVVRLDEDLTLAVSGILMLRAPHARAPVDEQLRGLLSKGEADTVPVDALKERVAGWRVRAAAAGTAPVQALESASADEAPAEAAAKSAPAAASPPPEPAPGAALDEALDEALDARAAIAKSGELARCLAAHVSELGLGEVPALVVRLRLEGGRVVDVRLGGALRVPACAPAAVGEALAGAPPDGVLEVEVPLR